ncbi:pirin family protein [Gloeomargarita lithophora]|uniref:pirin family protein n=1 Tax=Gloeomargarita lithophora TaxID=1188228 RepID=UPI003F70DAB3
MITIRKSAERGLAKMGWLTSYHTFSFGSYADPNFMGFGALRVINEDRVQPGQGFGTHAHRDMEIITYVLSGQLEHQDSLGTGSIIVPGEVQKMSAGTGIRHSEFNPSATEWLHLLQIWIIPNRRGLPPSYAQKNFTPAEKQGQLRLVGSGDGRQGSLTIYQDVNLYSSVLAVGEAVVLPLAPGRRAWVQVAGGEVWLNNQLLDAGDGAAVESESLVHLEGGASGGEVLVFDLAGV